ncbi:DExH-box ATP-dependent RNA helicase DExH3-like [Orbicella faveolata]|uniref:DExH-box ATP-dependent RNA helicase DExH3-like n=1 Tax=Orbicella faveolata TaxID=48498 RepID=UPI0009E4AF92|nr:DExH-box ATP-dependent RNA helicase DExH3-like [Orbicella faveolata]
MFQSDPVQASKLSQGSAVKETFPVSSTLGQSQTQTDCASAGASKNQEFWQDAEIVKDEDFSNWEMPHTPSTPSGKNSQNNAGDFTSVNSTAASGVIKDIFTGSPWRPLSAEKHKKLDGQLLQEFSQRQNMLQSRLSWFSEDTKRLPVANHRGKIIELIEANKVVVLSGETGCGKTTQIPQYILDHAIQNGKGSTCNIVVTQVHCSNSIHINFFCLSVSRSVCLFDRHSIYCNSKLSFRHCLTFYNCMSLLEF